MSRDIRILVLFLCTLVLNIYTIKQKEMGVRERHIMNIGDIEYAYYIYSDSKNTKLYGIFVYSKEGNLALLNPDTGKIMWRQIMPIENKIVEIDVYKEYCLLVRQKSSAAELWNLETGNLARQIPYHQNASLDQSLHIGFLKRSPIMTYFIQTNSNITIYERMKFKESKIANENETFLWAVYENDTNDVKIFIHKNLDEFLSIEYYYNKENFSNFQIPFNKKFDSLDRSSLEIMIKSTRKSILMMHKINTSNILFAPIPDGHRFLGSLPNSELVVTEDKSSYGLHIIYNMQLVQLDSASKSSTNKVWIGADINSNRIILINATKKFTHLYELLMEKEEEERSFVKYATAAKHLRLQEFGGPKLIIPDAYSDKIIIKTDDLTLHLMENKKIKWKKYEGISKIRKIMENDNINIGPSSEQKGNSIIDLAKEYIYNLLPQNSHENKSKDKENNTEQNQDKFTFSKNVYIISPFNTIYAIDFEANNIIWQRHFNAMLIDAFIVKSGSSINIAVVLSHKNKGYLSILKVENGEKLKQNDDLLPIKPLDVFLFNDGADDILIMIDKSQHLFFYPSAQNISSELLNKLRNYPYLKYHMDNKTINCFSFFDKIKLFETCQIHIGKNEDIISIIETKNYKGKYPQKFEINGVIAFKYKQPLFILATNQSSIGIMLRIYDSLYGNLLQETYLPHAIPQSLTWATEENYLIFGYLTKEGKLIRQEIMSIELCEKKIISDVKEVLTNYLSSSNEQKKYLEMHSLMTLNLSYTFPTPIKSMGLSRTRNGITNKHLGIITTNNYITLLPYAAISPRKPVEDADRPKLNRDDSMKQWEENDFAPYEGSIPYFHKQITSYDLETLGINEIQFIPGLFESETRLVSSGIDLFYKSLTPEGTFDIINSSFLGNMALLSFVLIVIGIYIARKFMIRKTSKENFHFR